MADLLELAARIEAATGPDRELDCLIRESFDPRYKPEQRVLYYGEPTGEHVDHFDGSFVKSPTFTASLDAAMTLYVELPDRVPSDPRKATAEALRQRASHE